MQIQFPTEEEEKEALDSFFSMMAAGRAAAKRAEKDLLDNSDILIQAIRTRSGQSEKVSRIIRSIWNGDWKTGLCDDLACLDHAIGVAVLALIAARIHMGGDADPIIRTILQKSGEFDRMTKDREES